MIDPFGWTSQSRPAFICLLLVCFTLSLVNGRLVVGTAEKAGWLLLLVMRQGALNLQCVCRDRFNVTLEATPVNLGCLGTARAPGQSSCQETVNSTNDFFDRLLCGCDRVSSTEHGCWSAARHKSRRFCLSVHLSLWLLCPSGCPCTDTELNRLPTRALSPWPLFRTHRQVCSC